MIMILLNESSIFSLGDLILCRLRYYKPYGLTIGVAQQMRVFARKLLWVAVHVGSHFDVTS